MKASIQHWMRGGAFLFLLKLLVSTSSAQTAQIPTVAVMPLEASGVTADEAKLLASRLNSELVRVGAFRVVERTRVDDLLREMGFQQSGACATNECVAEVGKLLSVQYMVGGTVGRIGQTLVLDTRLIEVSSGRIIRTTSDNHQGPVEGLLEILKNVAIRLADRQEQPPPSRPLTQISQLQSQIMADGITIATRSQQYYRTPIQLGGGGYSCKGFEISPDLQETAHAKYSAMADADHSLTIVGIGKELGSANANPIRVTMKVLPTELTATMEVENPAENQKPQKFLVKFSLEGRNYVLLDEAGNEVKLNLGKEAPGRAEKEALMRVNRGALLSGCAIIASKSQNYYRMPKKMGGGAHSFKGYQIPPELQKTATGSYTIIVDDDHSMTIVGISKGRGYDGVNPERVEMKVSPAGIKTAIKN